MEQEGLPGCLSCGRPMLKLNMGTTSPPQRAAHARQTLQQQEEAAPGAANKPTPSGRKARATFVCGAAMSRTRPADDPNTSVICSKVPPGVSALLREHARAADRTLSGQVRSVLKQNETRPT
jgi:hypothetical protein